MTKHDQQQRREELNQAIRKTAAEIGFKGRGDTPRLAWEMDSRKIKPLRPHRCGWNGNWGGKWYGPTDPGVKLRGYISRNLPDLWENGAAGLQTPKCICSQCPLHGQAGCEREQVPAVLPKPEPVSNPSVSDVRDKPLETPVRDRLLETVRPRPSGSAANIGGWSVRQNNRGHFYGYKRINGKVRSCYLGKTLDGAEEKLAAAETKYLGERNRV